MRIIDDFWIWVLVNGSSVCVTGLGFKTTEPEDRNGLMAPFWPNQSNVA